MFSILLQAASGILNSFICTVYVFNNFDNVFHKKVHETCHYSRSIARKEKRKTEYLEYYFLMTKIHYICP